MKNSCRRFAKRTLITLAALTAVSTVGFAPIKLADSMVTNKQAIKSVRLLIS